MVWDLTYLLLTQGMRGPSLFGPRPPVGVDPGIAVKQNRLLGTGWTPGMAHQALRSTDITPRIVHVEMVVVE